MSYVVGSEVEAMAFTDHGVEYRPDGRLHAVDSESMTEAREALLGYAICGIAVRVWNKRDFDPADPAAHDDCKAIATAPGSDAPAQ